MAEIKGTNFRLDQEDADQFRIFSDERGWNQAQGFNHQMTLLELDRAKEAIPERQIEIADFEQHANAMVAAFLHSLELNQNAEARIRMEFAQELERNKTLLDEKIEQIKTMKIQMADLAGAAEQVKQLQAALDAAMEQARKDRLDAEERLADKSRALKDADARLSMLEIKAEGFDDLKADRDRLDKELHQSQQQVKDLKKDHKAALELAAAEAKGAQNTAVATARSEMQALIDAANERHATEVADLKDQIAEARIAGERAVREAVHEAEERAHEADKKAAEALVRAQMEIEMLQKQLAAALAKLPKE